MKLLVKKLREDAVLPKRGTDYSAGYDLSACIENDITIKPKEIVKIPTGLSVAPDRTDVALLIYPRSSLATKFGITLANCVGVVDSDYRGEIIVAMINLSERHYTIEKGERIAQLIATPILFPQIEEVEELSETARGEGGFGSTGKK